MGHGGGTPLDWGTVCAAGIGHGAEGLQNVLGAGFRPLRRKHSVIQGPMRRLQAPMLTEAKCEW